MNLEILSDNLIFLQISHVPIFLQISHVPMNVVSVWRLYDKQGYWLLQRCVWSQKP